MDCTWADWTDWGECTCAKLATRSRKIEVEASGSPSTPRREGREGWELGEESVLAKQETLDVVSGCC